MVPQKHPQPSMPTISEVDPASMSRVASMPGQQVQMQQPHQTSPMNQQSTDACANDLADPKTQQALANMQTMFQQVQQNPQLKQQIQEKLNQPQYKAFNEFLATVGGILNRNQITNVDPLQLCWNVKSEERRAYLNELSGKLGPQEQKDLQLVTTNLENAIRDPNLIKHAEAELMNLVSQAYQQLQSIDPNSKQDLTQLEQQQSQVIHCKESILKRSLGKMGSLFSKSAAVVVKTLWATVGSTITAVSSFLFLLIFYILHIVGFLATLLSGQGIFAAFTSTMTRFSVALLHYSLGSNFLLSGGSFEERSMDTAQRTVASGLNRWAARDQGRKYYIGG